jgi:polyribonucleotide nucleotidyltransferase
VLDLNDPPERRFGGLSRREVGHGALAEKSLASMLPPEKEWPFVARINAETMVGTDG